MKKFHFIINPISGDNQKNQIDLDLLALYAAYPEIEIECHYTNSPLHAIDLANDAKNKNADAVIAVGGDGTVHEVGRALINSNCALGIIPSGSGNGFARHLKLPLNLKKAVERINQFSLKTIDTGLVNDIPFLATAGVGFDAHVAKKFAKFGKRGFLSYMQVSTNEFRNYKSKSYRFSIDGKPYEEEAFLIVIANAAQYGNNAWIAPSARIDDGLLNIGILKPFPPALLPDILFRLFNKSIESSKYYKKLLGKEVEIKKVKSYHTDGEPIKEKGKLKIKVVPNSLQVIS